MSFRLLHKKLPELIELEELLVGFGNRAHSEILAEIPLKSSLLPIHAMSIGCGDIEKPAVVFVGGVHGLERIGSQIILSYMQTLLARYSWDDTVKDLLSKVTLYFVPIVNPGGMLKHWRANSNGVDLMRNAPVEAEGKTPWLVGGHRLTNKIPWYRGQENAPMEIESQALVSFINERVLRHRFVISLDCHSGFGKTNRIWFPYAKKLEPFENVTEVFALSRLFHRTYPYNAYCWEPQARQYTTHGDLWDYMYINNRMGHNEVFLPLTLEMGSWLWVKKNPWQITSKTGFFNPIVKHRLRRVLRQNLLLFDFLIQAAISWQNWQPLRRKRNYAAMRKEAMEHFYREYMTYTQ